MDGKPPAVHVVRPLTQTVEQDRVDQADQESKGAVRIRHDQKQRRPFVAQHIQIQLVVHGDLPDLFNIERRKSGSTGNKDRFSGLARRQLIFLVLP